MGMGEAARLRGGEAIANNRQVSHPAERLSDPGMPAPPPAPPALNDPSPPGGSAFIALRPHRVQALPGPLPEGEETLVRRQGSFLEHLARDTSARSPPAGLSVGQSPLPAVRALAPRPDPG